MLHTYNTTPKDDGSNDFFPFPLSLDTAVGYKVSLAATIELLEYLKQKYDYSYLMTSRLLSDPIEISFSKYFMMYFSRLNVFNIL